MRNGNGVILNALSARKAEMVLRKAFCGKKAAIFKYNGEKWSAMSLRSILLWCKEGFYVV